MGYTTIYKLTYDGFQDEFGSKLAKEVMSWKKPEEHPLALFLELEIVKQLNDLEDVEFEFMTKPTRVPLDQEELEGKHGLAFQFKKLSENLDGTIKLYGWGDMEDDQWRAFFKGGNMYYVKLEDPTVTTKASVKPKPVKVKEKKASKQLEKQLQKVA